VHQVCNQYVVILWSFRRTSIGLLFTLDQGCGRKN